MKKIVSIFILLSTLFILSTTCFAAGNIHDVVDKGWGYYDRYYTKQECYNMAMEYKKTADNYQALGWTNTGKNVTVAKYKWALGIKGLPNPWTIAMGATIGVAENEMRWYYRRCMEGYNRNGLIFRCYAGWMPYRIDDQPYK